MAWDFRLGRNFLQGGKKIFRIPHLYASLKNASLMTVFIPLWQRGIKGDFEKILGKSPLPPLFQRGGKSK
jgi:hypothetical protein